MGEIKHTEKVEGNRGTSDGLPKTADGVHALPGREIQVSACQIHYESIDVEIRKLVWLMNEFPGIQTKYSCAGHDEDTSEGYVSFWADSQEQLEPLARALPHLGWLAGLKANQFHWERIELSLRFDSDRKLVYDLRIFGFPRHVQRQLLARIEDALTLALADRG